MAAGAPDNDFGFPHFPPSPPHPHPHPLPPPVPVPPPPSPDPHPTVIIIVIVSFGCLFLAGAILFGIWCFFKRQKKKKLVQETGNIDVDEHLRVQETVVPGPHGPKTVVLSMVDDVHVHEDIRKNETDMVGKGLHAKSKDSLPRPPGTGSAGSSQQLTHTEHQV